MATRALVVSPPRERPTPWPARYINRTPGRRCGPRRRADTRARSSSRSPPPKSTSPVLSASASSAVSTRSQGPSMAQRRCRFHTVCPSPEDLRQNSPRHTGAQPIQHPSTILRFSEKLRPTRPSDFGNNSSSSSHCLSVSTRYRSPTTATTANMVPDRPHTAGRSTNTIGRHDLDLPHQRHRGSPCGPPPS